MNPKCLNIQSIEFILRLYFSMKFNIIIYIILLYITCLARAWLGAAVPGKRVSG